MASLVVIATEDIFLYKGKKRGSLCLWWMATPYIFANLFYLIINLTSYHQSHTLVNWILI